MKELRAVYTTILANSEDEANQLIPPCRSGFVRLANNLEQFNENLPYTIRIQILDKEVTN
jgi:hypothetical protein